MRDKNKPIKVTQFNRVGSVRRREDEDGINYTMFRIYGPKRRRVVKVVEFNLRNGLFGTQQSLTRTAPIFGWMGHTYNLF